MKNNFNKNQQKSTKIKKNAFVVLITFCNLHSKYVFWQQSRHQKIITDVLVVFFRFPICYLIKSILYSYLTYAFELTGNSDFFFTFPIPDQLPARRKNSNMTEIKAGIPQSSVFGPIFYLWKMSPLSHLLRTKPT